MATYDIRPLQLRILKNLLAIDKVCKEHNLRYYIMAGTMLGAPTPVLFENEEVWGVQEYDTYLSQKYGDYMTIPKQSGQRQHNFHYLDLNKPYRDFEV